MKCTNHSTIGFMFASLFALTPACSGGDDSSSGGDGDGDIGDGDVGDGDVGDGDAGDGDVGDGDVGDGDVGDGDVGDGDVGDGDAGDGDTSAPVAKNCGPVAMTTADGVLTAYPNMSLSISEGWRILSANPVAHETPSELTAVEIYFEIENTGTETQCTLFADSTVDFFSDTLIQVAGPPYKSENSNIVSPCVAPGETAVAWISTNDLVEEDFEDLEVDIFMQTVANSTFSPSLPQLGQLITAEPVLIEEGNYGISGEVTFVQELSNYSFDVFVKDEQGLIFADFSSYPDSGALFFDGSSTTFEEQYIWGNACEFSSAIVFETWIDEEDD